MKENQENEAIKKYKDIIFQEYGYKDYNEFLTKPYLKREHGFLSFHLNLIDKAWELFIDSEIINDIDFNSPNQDDFITT